MAMDGIAPCDYIFGLHTIVAISRPLSFRSDGCVLDMDSVLVKR
jgi:hypothetical protein